MAFSALIVKGPGDDREHRGGGCVTSFHSCDRLVGVGREPVLKVHLSVSLLGYLGIKHRPPNCPWDNFS